MYMQFNATVIDSSIYHDIFSTTAMRAVWSDQARVQRYLDVEKALSLVKGRLGVIPSEAAEEIGRHCNVSKMDFERMKSAMGHIGDPVLLLFRRGEVESPSASVRLLFATVLAKFQQSHGSFD
jgi:adenylosuccinate lyase